MHATCLWGHGLQQLLENQSLSNCNSTIKSQQVCSCKWAPGTKKKIDWWWSACQCSITPLKKGMREKRHFWGGSKGIRKNKTVKCVKAFWLWPFFISCCFVFSAWQRLIAFLFFFLLKEQNTYYLHCCTQWQKSLFTDSTEWWDVCEWR